MPKIKVNYPENMDELEKRVAQIRAKMMAKRLTYKQLEFYIKCLEEGKL